ncbi:MAG: dolichyl-phosphate beta-glucosyltransferase [Dehalococcoidia bacterium]
MPSVDLIIPVYNEERVLAESVEKLRAWAAEGLPWRWRVVVADNASTDATLEVAQRLAADHADDVAVIHLDRKGRGRALKRAWLESPADAMCYMDVDLSTDLEHVRPLLASVVDEGCDVAYGSRLARSADIERSFRREVNSRGYNLVIKALFWTKFSDAQCGFKAITRDAARELLPHVRDREWFFDTELLILAEKAGYRLKEIPVRWVEDPDSRVRFPQDIWKMGSRLVRLRLRRIPGREELARMAAAQGTPGA